jgi:hypothetical protein
LLLLYALARLKHDRQTEIRFKRPTPPCRPSCASNGSPRNLFNQLDGQELRLPMDQQVYPGR